MAHLPEYKFDTGITILNLGDIHFGNAAFHKPLLDKAIEYILNNPNCYWLSTGDIFEMALKDSLSFTYGGMAPSHEFYKVASLLKPIASKCLGLVESNHHDRFKRATSFSVDKLLADEIKIPFLGTLAVIKVTCGSASYYIAMLHGTGGGKQRGSKVNNTQNLINIVGGCDVYMNGHTHTYNHFPDLIYYVDKKRGNLVGMESQFVTTGHCLKYFDSYALGKWYPTPMGFAQITLKHALSGNHNNKDVSCKLFK